MKARYQVIVSNPLKKSYHSSLDVLVWPPSGAGTGVSGHRSQLPLDMFGEAEELLDN